MGIKGNSRAGINYVSRVYPTCSPTGTNGQTAGAESRRECQLTNAARTRVVSVAGANPGLEPAEVATADCLRCVGLLHDNRYGSADRVTLHACSLDPLPVASVGTEACAAISSTHTAWSSWLPALLVDKMQLYRVASTQTAWSSWLPALLVDKMQLHRIACAARWASSQ